MGKKLAFALDVRDVEQAKKILKEIKGLDIIVKIGYVLFINGGEGLVKYIKDSGFEVFLDLKLHDIPNTVFNGVYAVKRIGVDYLTIHTLGGPEMIKRAIEAKENSELKLLGVTVLTSHGNEYLDYIGTKYSLKQLVLKLARTGVDLGLDGIVCSPEEVKELKKNIKKPFLAVVPGIRIEGGESDDQTRIATPEKAINQGADIIVVGRPILRSDNKKEFIQNILSKIK